MPERVSLRTPYRLRLALRLRAQLRQRRLQGFAEAAAASSSTHTRVRSRRWTAQRLRGRREGIWPDYRLQKLVNS